MKKTSEKLDELLLDDTAKKLLLKSKADIVSDLIRSLNEEAHAKGLMIVVSDFNKEDDSCTETGCHTMVGNSLQLVHMLLATIKKVAEIHECEPEDFAGILAILMRWYKEDEGYDMDIFRSLWEKDLEDED